MSSFGLWIATLTSQRRGEMPVTCGRRVVSRGFPSRWTSQADLDKFLEIARQMDAPIVGPTFANALVKLYL